ADCSDNNTLPANNFVMHNKGVANRLFLCGRGFQEGIRSYYERREYSIGVCAACGAFPAATRDVTGTACASYSSLAHLYLSSREWDAQQSLTTCGREYCQGPAVAGR